MLHPIVHDNRSHLWCGPAAIAMVTGQPTSVIHRLAREYRRDQGRRNLSVSGMTVLELEHVMERLGYKRGRFPLNGIYRTPLWMFLATIAFEHLHQEHPLIVHLPKHVAVIYRGQFADCVRTEPGPLPERWHDAPIYGMTAWAPADQVRAAKEAATA